jgi:hypothetical protein
MSDYKEAIPLIMSHLESLTDSLDQYFPSLSSELYDWVRNPFIGFPQNSPSMQKEEQFTELQCDCTLKMKFSEVPLDVFWISVRKEYPVISAKTVKILLQFSTSYICEQAFSCLTKAKTETVCFLSRKNCEHVCQNSSQELNICEKRNMLMYHKVNFTVTFDVNFILIFNFILTCYFDIF